MKNTSKLVLLLVLLFAPGCALSRAAGAPPLTPRCISLSDRADLWTAIGSSAAALSGAGGLATIPVSDKDGRIAIGISTVVLGALAIAANMTASTSVSNFSRECQ